MPGILALDPARVLGWAHALPGGALEFGHKELAPRGAVPGKIGAGLSLFLTAMLSVTKPDLLVYEQPFLSSKFVSGTSAFVLLGIGFSIDTIAVQCGVEYYSVMAMEATKALTGRGTFPGVDYARRRKAKKAATVAACRARGWDATEDEADAIAVLLLAEAKRYPLEAMRRPMVMKPPRGPLFAEVGP